MFPRHLLTPRKILLAVIAILLIAGGIAYYVRYVHVPEGAESFRSTYDLTLKDYAGNDVDLGQFRRELLVVHAWASWCPYCGTELENLAQLMQTFGDRVTIIAVNRAEPLQDAKTFSDALGVSGMQFLIDPNDSFYKSIEGYAMPETIFIDRRGVIIHHQRGPMNIEEVTEKIKTLIGE